jgi:hypothetical protein
VKFDGWRIQLHKPGGSAAAFTKNGHDHSSRVRWMIDALACLKGVRSLVIDGELVVGSAQHAVCQIRQGANRMNGTISTTNGFGRGKSGIEDETKSIPPALTTSECTGAHAL